MLLALLALLGVDLVVVAALAAALLVRRRWVRAQEGAFRASARLLAGDVRGLGTRSRRGYGRWVRDVLVWTPAPLLLRNALVPVDRVDGTQPAPAGQVRRLGSAPVRVVLTTEGSARIELTVAAEDEARAVAPFSPRSPARRTADSTLAPDPASHG